MELCPIKHTHTLCVMKSGHPLYSQSPLPSVLGNDYICRLHLWQGNSASWHHMVQFQSNSYISEAHKRSTDPGMCTHREVAGEPEDSGLLNPPTSCPCVSSFQRWEESTIGKSFSHLVCSISILLPLKQTNSGKLCSQHLGICKSSIYKGKTGGRWRERAGRRERKECAL